MPEPRHAPANSCACQLMRSKPLIAKRHNLGNTQTKKYSYPVPYALSRWFYSNSRRGPTCRTSTISRKDTKANNNVRTRVARLGGWLASWGATLNDNEHRPSSSFVAAACLLTTSFIQLRLHFLVRMSRGGRWCARVQAMLSPLKSSSLSRSLQLGKETSKLIRKTMTNKELILTWKKFKTD